MTTLDDTTPILLAKILFLLFILMITRLSRHKWLVFLVIQTTFLSAQKLQKLEEVEISVKPLEEKKFGIKKRNTGLHFIDGIADQKSQFEIAQIFRFPSVPNRITSLNIHIQNKLSDSITFRINFYRFNGEKPDERLLQRSITQKKEVKEGWLKFDLRREQVYLKGEVVVALEFISDQKPKQQIDFEVKLGGQTKTFTRSANNHDWQQIPHHYVIYVTALVSDNPEEEVVNSAAHKIYSVHVKDTFSIFVQTPMYASKTKHYPVVYLLDANAYFDEIAQQMRLAELKGKPSAILIGIGYKDPYEMDSLRLRDYTFPEALSSDSCKSCGGGDKFYDFIKQELTPFVDLNYKTDSTKRLLMGHSLGGYFSLYALSHDVKESKSIFNTYVSASPSLEYHDHYLQKEFKTLQTTSTKCKLFLSYGGKEEGKEDFTAFVKTLNCVESLDVKSRIIPKADHMETSLPTFSKSVELFLKD